MNKSLLIGVVVVIVLAAGVGMYTSNSGSKKEAAMMEKEKMTQEAAEKESMVKEEMMKEDAMMEEKGEMMMKDEGAMMEEEEGGAMMHTGSYEAYSTEKVAMASATHDVVLFFRASWCPTCRALDADLRAHLKDIPESLTILDVNYDTATDLKKKYGVTYQHTFVQVDAQGNLIKKWSGSSTLASLVAEVK